MVIDDRLRLCILPVQMTRSFGFEQKVVINEGHSLVNGLRCNVSLTLHQKLRFLIKTKLLNESLRFLKRIL